MVTSAAPACQALETFRKPQSPGRCLSTGRGGVDTMLASPRVSRGPQPPPPRTAQPRAPRRGSLRSSRPPPRSSALRFVTLRRRPTDARGPIPVRARTERRCQAQGAQMPLCERPLRTIFLPSSPHGGERGRGEERKKELRRENRRKREKRPWERVPPRRAHGDRHAALGTGEGASRLRERVPGHLPAPFATRIPRSTASG